jgi:hypothetical protein
MIRWISSSAIGACGNVVIMDNRPSKACIAAGIALAVVVTTAASLESDPYLPKVGPTSLRFKAAGASKSLNLPPLAKEDNTATVTNMPANVENVDIVTRVASPDPVVQQYFFQSPWIYPLPRADAQTDVRGSAAPAPAHPATNAPPTSQAASDMLVVTPQMLVDYFKPPPTNATNASVPATVEFTPATPATTSSGNSPRSP